MHLPLDAEGKAYDAVKFMFTARNRKLGGYFPVVDIEACLELFGDLVMQLD